MAPPGTCQWKQTVRLSEGLSASSLGTSGPGVVLGFQTRERELMEHSEYERGLYVTEQVSLWIVNDGEHYFHAVRKAGMATDSTFAIASFIRQTLKTAPNGSVAWHVAQELAPNDYGRIDWKSVVNDLVGDGDGGPV